IKHSPGKPRRFNEQFDEINIVRGKPVSGGRLEIKITEVGCA
ncbi:hypothetical protein ACT32C_005304, partial [Escherichia coli]